MRSLGSQFALLFAVVALLLTASSAHANIIATSYNTPCSPPTNCSFEGGSPPSPYPTLEQQFTLTLVETITSVDAALAYSIDDGPFPAQDLVMTIVNDASGVIGSTVLATNTVVTGVLTAFPTVGYSDVNFAFSDPTLGPGTYWLVIQVGSPFNQQSHLFDWQTQVFGTVNPPGDGGVINPVSGFGSTYGSDTYMTTINGTPEPATVFMALGALTLLCALRRRFAAR